MALNSSGHMLSSSLARELLRDFDGLSRRLTFDLYQTIFGKEADEGNFVPTAEALSERQQREAALGALTRFYLNVPLVQISVYPPSGSVQTDASTEECLAALQDAREQMPSAVAAAVPDIEGYFAADERRRLLKLGLGLSSAGIRFKPKALNLSTNEQAGLKNELAETEFELTSLRERLQPAMRIAWARLEVSLALLNRPEYSPVLQGINVDIEQTAKLLTTLEALGAVSHKLRALRWLSEELDPLLEMAGDHPANERLQQQANVLSTAAQDLLRVPRSSLSEMAYPFPYGNSAIDVTVADYRMPKLPEQAPSAILEVTAGVVWRIGLLYGRIWSELALMAESVEEVLGLNPLPPISWPKGEK